MEQQQKNAKLDDKLISINVSGQQFLISSDTLGRYPETKLGKLVLERPTVKGYFFESDVNTFKEVLKFYQKGKLHCPKNICFSDFCENLEYWKVDLSYLSECCSEDLKDEQEMEKQFQFFNNKFQMPDKNVQCCRDVRYIVWSFLTDPHGSDKTWKIGAKVWMVLYFLITCVSGMTLAVTTQPFSVSDINLSSNSNMSLQDQNTTPVEMESSLPTSCIYLRKWRKSKIVSFDIALLTLGLLIFYAVEIWIRFFFCPNKRLFWRSINGLDMLISICESVSITYIAYFDVNFNTLATGVGGRIYCELALSLTQTVIVVGQLRFIRFLSYASLYR